MNELSRELLVKRMCAIVPRDEINMKNIVVEKFSHYLSFVSVSMVREKDDGSDYNGRRGELIAYDHTPLDGEFFLQVRLYIVNYQLN